MTPAERKQIIYAMKRSAWRQNFFTHTGHEWKEISDTFAAQARRFIAAGELTLAAEAMNHANVFAAIARADIEPADGTV